MGYLEQRKIERLEHELKISRESRDIQSKRIESLILENVNLKDEVRDITKISKTLMNTVEIMDSDSENLNTYDDGVDDLKKHLENGK